MEVSLDFLTSKIELKKDLGEKNMICESHGDYIAAGAVYMGSREIWTQCPDCKEAELAQERQAEATEKAEAHRKRINDMVSDSGIPARFIGSTFENFVAETDAKKRALHIAQDFAKNFQAHSKAGRGLIFSGLPGTGKSHLAGAILKQILPDNVGLYVTCMGLIRAVRETWRKDSEKTEAQVLRMFCTVPLLVIDEIGVQYGTDGEQTIIFDVLDRRYRDMQSSILLTNQNTEGFKTFVGERTHDRLVQTCRWVNFDWESYRPTARKLEAA